MIKSEAGRQIGYYPPASSRLKKERPGTRDSHIVSGQRKERNWG